MKNMSHTRSKVKAEVLNKKAENNKFNPSYVDNREALTDMTKQQTYANRNTRYLDAHRRHLLILLLLSFLEPSRITQGSHEVFKTIRHVDLQFNVTEKHG